MHILKFALILSLGLFMGSCSDDDPMEMENTPDTLAPLIDNLRWIDSPFHENDPVGDINPGSVFEISIGTGFQFIASVTDQNNIESALGYMTINNDPEIIEYILYPGTELGYSEGTFTFTHRVPSFSLGNGVFYELKAGDTMQFYLSFVDEFENEAVVEWSAILVE